MSQSPEVAVDVRHLSKSFGGVHALRDVSLQIRAGEIHALLGQNGCGKSTLIKCITGVHAPDEGTVTLWGQALHFPVASPAKLGIATIHQDLGIVDDLSVLDNLSIAAAYNTRLLGPIRERRERRVYAQIAAEIGQTLDYGQRAGDLTPAERTLLAVIRAMRLLEGDSTRHVFILDEPTTSLAGADADRVLSLMRRVADAGAAVVFISHRLAEVVSTCDRVTILRDGQVISTHTDGPWVREELVREILGRRMDTFYPQPPARPAENRLLSITGLSGAVVNELSFGVDRGEVVGVTGLTGMGHEELPYLLTGATKPAAGTVRLGEVEIAHDPRASIDAGVALVPGNRARDGVWLQASAAENITLPQLSSYRGPVGLRSGQERRQSHAAMQQMMVRPPNARALVASFSGGNQQKIVLAEWLSTKPQLLILDEPTQGVDAGAKRELLDLALNVARTGGAIVMCSGDHEQLAAVCHRVLVLKDGRLSTELSQDKLSEATLLAACNSGEEEAAR